MPIHPIDRFRSAERTQGPRGSTASETSRDSKASQSDGIEISEEARGQLEVHELVAAVRTAAAALPEVRADRVDLARQRVQQGYYERPDVRGSIVDALLKVFRKDGP
jgi:hypothetical protein